MIRERWQRLRERCATCSRVTLGLGIILLNSNTDSHFSFTNALGMVSAGQVRGIDIARETYPDACWIIALHHHIIEYPWAARALSERIGTALINGNWFMRSLKPRHHQFHPSRQTALYFLAWRGRR